MRLARIATPAGPRHAVADGADWAVVEDVFARPLVPTGERHPQDGARLLAPVEPRVVLGMAHNTGPADRELPPQAFMKSARTVVGPGDAIRLDPRRGEVKVEGELAVVVRRQCRNLAPEEVPDAVLGWTVGNDVTAVDQVALDEKMTQSKNGDGFTPLGPWVETELDPRDVAIEVRVGDEVAAAGSTSGLARDVVELLVYLTAHLDLGPGDVVLTGAPGTGATVVPGDRAAITLAGIGTLTNPVVRAAL
ncbi:fumarylacetoacetate hydrolase family protein [Georgenia sp. AZ-5]|uniref:fumarylacetoacetate hydrolase family protein n=1 Tax=Georgenia sp. AZ-5 TaxID=3367526 RepID=UPI00375441FE